MLLLLFYDCDVRTLIFLFSCTTLHAHCSIIFHLYFVFYLLHVIKMDQLLFKCSFDAEGFNVWRRMNLTQIQANKDRAL